MGSQLLLSQLLFHLPSVLLPLLIDIFLDVLECDVGLSKSNVAVSKQAAHFSYVGGSDCVVAVSPGHGLRKSNQRLKLSDRDLVRSPATCVLSLSDALVLLLQDLSTFLGELRVDGSAELDVGLNLFH